MMAGSTRYPVCRHAAISASSSFAKLSGTDVPWPRFRPGSQACASDQDAEYECEYEKVVRAEHIEETDP